MPSRTPPAVSRPRETRQQCVVCRRMRDTETELIPMRCCNREVCSHRDRHREYLIKGHMVGCYEAHTVEGIGCSNNSWNVKFEEATISRQTTFTARQGGHAITVVNNQQETIRRRISDEVAVGDVRRHAHEQDVRTGNPATYPNSLSTRDGVRIPLNYDRSYQPRRGYR